MKEPNVWKKPLTPDDEREIKAMLSAHPRDVPFACFNNDEELRLVFPPIAGAEKAA